MNTLERNVKLKASTLRARCTGAVKLQYTCKELRAKLHLIFVAFDAAMIMIVSRSAPSNRCDTGTRSVKSGGNHTDAERTSKLDLTSGSIIVFLGHIVNARMK